MKGHNEISLQPSLLQAEQPQLSQPFLFCLFLSCTYSAEGQEVSTHCNESVDNFEIFMPLSAISMAIFISIFLYNDTMLDLGWCSRIKIFFKYLLSNFLNLQKTY